jgi:hypothetical protein
VKNIIYRDYKTYSSLVLERYFLEKTAATGNFSAIGGYWESGNRNEIDIVAVNEREKIAVIAEVKRQADHINLSVLRTKAADLMRQLGGYSVEYKGLSMSDM